MSGKNNTRCVKCVVRIVTTSLQVFFGLQEVQLAISKAKKNNKTTNFGISGNSPHPVFGVVHFGAFHFGREIVTVHSHHEGPLVKQRIKVHPPHGELVVCSKNLHFWLWGWREQHLGREKFQYFSGNNEAAPSEAAEFV